MVKGVMFDQAAKVGRTRNVVSKMAMARTTKDTKKKRSISL
jgi:hypothetical protein